MFVRVFKGNLTSHVTYRFINTHSYFYESIAVRINIDCQQDLASFKRLVSSRLSWLSSLMREDGEPSLEPELHCSIGWGPKRIRTGKWAEHHYSSLLASWLEHSVTSPLTLPCSWHPHCDGLWPQTSSNLTLLLLTRKWPVIKMETVP